MKFDRNLKLYCVPQHQVLIACQMPQALIKYNFEEKLPEDAQVIGVHHNYLTRCFEFVVHSLSFPIVLVGYELPRVNLKEAERL